MRFITLATLLMLPLTARAADLPVRYTVDYTILKGAVAGTDLTFELYADANCTPPATHVETVAIENVAVIARLKRFKVAGSATAPPKAAELSQTLTGVSGSGNLYLKLTGTGVTSVGGACQAQAASIPSPPGFSITIKDVDGDVVGSPTPGGFHVVVGGRVAGVAALLPTGIPNNSGSGLFFTSTNCTGPMLTYTEPDGSVIVGAIVRTSTNAQRTLYVAPLTGAITPISSELRWGPSWTPAMCSSVSGTSIAVDECCISASFTNDMGPPLTKDVSNLTPPFHAE